VEPVYRLQRKKFKEHREALARYEEEKAEYERQKRKGTAPGPCPQPPRCSRVVCSDTTIERLGDLLEDNSRGLLLSRDELGAWLGSFERYRACGSDLLNWLELHRAGRLVVDRKSAGGRTTFVPRAAVSVAGTIQPSILAAALRVEHWESGLVARLLPAMPPRKPKRWSDLEIHPDTQKGYEDLLGNLYSST
jgi:hypothetical protein